MQLQHAASDSRPVTLHVGREPWQFSITGVTRVGNELFISATLLGSELCTAVIHIHDGVVPGVTVRRLLEAVCEWLVVRGRERHTYLDLAEPAAVRASGTPAGRPRDVTC